MNEDVKSYNLSVEETLDVYKTSYDGLSQNEANERLEKYGKNKLIDKKKKGILSRILEQLSNIMLIILIIAATISLVTAKLNNESITESMIIYFVVVLNVILGVVQESKADKAIDALKKMSLPYIKVRRGGKILSIKTEDLVIGDIVLIEAGDYVPADIRLINTNSVRVEEAALTRRICSF